MSSSGDYFANHRLKLRFPWRLYHEPIVEQVRGAIEARPAGDVLNIGSGPFFEFDALPQEGRRYTICDVDERAVRDAQLRLGSRLHGAHVVSPGGKLPFSGSSFDIVFATEVVEHVATPEPWIVEALRVLRPGGLLLLTTPNYGSWSLRWLERTVLEAVARAQGFSRTDIHPSRFDRKSLTALLVRCGALNIDVRTAAYGWVLVAKAGRSM